MEDYSFSWNVGITQKIQLDKNISPFTQNYEITLVNYETIIGMTALKTTELYRTTKISLLKENLWIGKPGVSVVYILHKIFFGML